MKRFKFYICVLLAALFAAVLFSALFTALLQTPDSYVDIGEVLFESETEKTDLPAEEELPELMFTASVGYLTSGQGTSEPDLAETIAAGFAALDEEIDISAFGLPNNQSGINVMMNAVSYVKYSDADYFYVSDRYGYSVVIENGVQKIKAVHPIYLYTGEEFERIFADYDARVNAIVSLCDENFTDFEKVLFYHDYLNSHYEYDYVHSADLKNFDAYGIMRDGVGVCQAYTLLYNELLDRSGVETTFAQSDSMLHIWSVVTLDGKHYHVDVTWDEGFVGNACHTNFLLSDAGITASGHYGWVCDYSCPDRDYESWWGKDATSPFVTLDGDSYTVLGDKLVKCSDDYESYTAVKSFGIWRPFDKPTAYYPDVAFTGLGAFGGKLYYNDMYNIYSYDVETGTQTEVLHYSGGKGYIFGSAYDGSKVKYQICTTSDPDSEVVTVTDTLIMKGDGDEDGDIDGDDVTVLRSIILMPEPEYRKTLDLDGDGALTLSDLLRLRRFVEGADPKLNVTADK